MGGGGGFVGSVQNTRADVDDARRHRARARLRHRRHRHRSSGHGHRRELGAQQPRARAQLRPPRRAPHRRGVESDRQAVLRQGRRALVLHRLLARRRPGHDGVAALPRRLRRHRRRARPPTTGRASAPGSCRPSRRSTPTPPTSLRRSSPTPTARCCQKEILAACDKLDGVEDRLLDDPRRCKFDPAKLPRCANDQGGDDCVTEAAARWRSRRSTKGRSSTASASTPASRSAARTTSAVGTCGSPAVPNAFGPGQPSLHMAFGTNMFKYIIYDDPKWDYSKYQFANFDQDTARAAEILNATDVDLTKFQAVQGQAASSGTAGPIRRSPRSAPSGTTNGWRPRTRRK